MAEWVEVPFHGRNDRVGVRSSFVIYALLHSRKIHLTAVFLV